MISVKPSEVYPSSLHSWIDYLNIEPASGFKNAITNWLLEKWTHQSLIPRIRQMGLMLKKQNQY